MLPVAASPSVSDSLRIAEHLADRGGDCVAAFTAAARRFPEELDGTESLAQTAYVFRTLAHVSRLGGDSADADVFSEAALVLADAAGIHEARERSRFLLVRALSVRLVGGKSSRADAETLVEEARELVSADGSVPDDLHADPVQAAANLARASSAPERAVRLYRRALGLRLREGSVHRLAVVDNECWLALALLKAGEVEASEQLFVHCRQDLRRIGLGDHPLAATVLTHLAGFARRRGDVPLALEHNRRALPILERAQDRLFPGFGRRRMESPVRSRIAGLHLLMGQPEQAWRAFAWARRRAGVEAAALAQARDRDPALVEALTRQAMVGAHMAGEVTAALRSLRETSLRRAPSSKAVETLVRYARQRARTLGLEDRLRRAHGKRWDRDERDRAVSELQGGLGPSQAVLGYLFLPDSTMPGGPSEGPVWYAVILRQEGGARWVRLTEASNATASDLSSVWARYLRLMSNASEWPTRLPDDPRLKTLLHELYIRCFQPLEPFLGGVRELLVYPSDLRTDFPFPALVDDGGHALVDRYRFRSLLGLRDGDRHRSDPPSGAARDLVLGDPRFDPGVDADPEGDPPNPTLAEALSIHANTVLTRSMIQDVLTEGPGGVTALPRLRSSGWEARGIAQIVPGATLLTGRDATEQALQRAFGGPDEAHYRVIHLATHALVDPAIPERSALALSPRAGEGLLYVEEIGFGWNLECDLVTLSGCQTSGGPISPSTGPLGFTQMLLAAGARHLLLSTTKIDDVATALLMERFYADVFDRSSSRVAPADGAPLEYSAALAEAQRWLRDLRDGEGRRPFAHPTYWANFVLIGR